MRSYTKYKALKRPPKRGVRFFLGVILLTCLGVVAWYWWQRSKEPQARASSKSETGGTNRLEKAPDLNSTNASVASSTNAIVTVTNPPPVVTAKEPVVRITNALVTSPALVASNPPSPAPTPFTARTPRNAYEVQVALARRGFSPGSLDGAMGSQTRAALRAFQEREHLPATGDLDAATKDRLVLVEAPEKSRIVTTNDLERLLAVGKSWLEKSQQSRLDYENILELVAEEGQAHPNLIRLLNPSVDWTNVVPGTSILIPNVQSPAIRGKAALLRIRLGEKYIRAWDSSSNLLAHFPCSIARNVEKRPVGQLFVEKIALNPNYRFDPEVFPESTEARKLNRKLLIPPGPNNPVGVAWIGLSRPGYGIHGTPRPEEVGRTESHGCFRLANWNAQFLAQIVRNGTPVFVEP